MATGGAASRLLLGGIHCHSVFSDGSATPREMLAAGGRVGLDFLVITDHVPATVDDHAGLPDRGGRFPSSPGDFPVAASGLVRVPGLEYSPRKGHYLVLGAEPWEAPDPGEIPGWPALGSCVQAVCERPGLLGFIAHPDDEGSSFLKVPSYAWGDWGVSGFTGLEVWNMATDLARTLRGYRDLLRAAVAGPYRAVPPPNPATLARWDSLARRRKVVGIAGTDAHAYVTRWHGIPLTVLPYERAFAALETGVWVERPMLDGPAPDRVAGILEAIRRGRTLMVNRAWGHPLGFVFQARRLASPGPPFVSGDVIPAGCEVRFEVAAPASAWIRLLRDGVPVANTYGRELTLEPFGGPAAAAVGDVQEAWRAEVWVSSSHWSRYGSGFFLWILASHIYRALDPRAEAERERDGGSPGAG